MKTENEKLGSESAFPISETKQTESIELGMSKRFYAVCAVTSAILTNRELLINITNNLDNNEANTAIVNHAYTVVEELLKQENL